MGLIGIICLGAEEDVSNWLVQHSKRCQPHFDMNIKSLFSFVIFYFGLKLEKSKGG